MTTNTTTDPHEGHTAEAGSSKPAMAHHKSLVGGGDPNAVFLTTKRPWRVVLNCFAKNPTEEIIKSVYRTRAHDPEYLNKHELIPAYYDAMKEIRK